MVRATFTLHDSDLFALPALVGLVVLIFKVVRGWRCKYAGRLSGNGQVTAPS
jgi:hypothetical protein